MFFRKPTIGFLFKYRVTPVPDDKFVKIHSVAVKFRSINASEFHSTPD